MKTSLYEVFKHKYEFPSLPMAPHRLKLAFGVKRALGVLLAFEENGGSSALIWNVVPYVVMKDLSSSPFSALPAQRIWPANELRPFERRVRVRDYTHCNASVVHFFVIWITVQLLVLWRITRRFFDVSGISTTRL